MPDPTTTAQQILDGAFELIGVKALGQALEAAIVQDGFRRLNNLVDTWGIEPGTILSIERQVFPIVGGVQSYTIGAGGVWDTPRPTVIDRAGLVMLNTTPSIEIPLSVLSQQAYEAIAVKGLQSTLPTQLYYDQAYTAAGLGTVFLWPAPTIATNVIALYTEMRLAAFVSVAGTVRLAPGFREALEYNLACRLAAPYGRPVQPDVLLYAKSTLANVKRRNTPTLDLALDAGLTPASRQGTFNILVGP